MGVYFITHTLPCVALSDVLLQLRAFLQQHPTEVVVVRACRDWDNKDGFTELDGDDMLCMVRTERLLGNRRIDSRFMNTRTFLKQWKSGFLS